MEDLDNPSDAEVLKAAIESRLLDVHTAIPGRVVTYDKETQTANVLPMVKRTLQREDGMLVHYEYPVIQNVPIGWFASGGFAMQFPVKKNDTVWVMFGESAWAQWRETGELSEAGDLRRFDLSYPIAIPICRPASKVLTPIGDNEAVIDVPTSNWLRVGGISAQFVALSNLVMNELNKIRDAFNGHTHGPGSFSTPSAGGGGGAVAGNSGGASNMPAIAPVAATKLKSE